MYKLRTLLSFFRFNSTIQQGPIPVTWFVLQSDDDLEESGRCFTQEERDQFLEFTLNNSTNFPGTKDNFACTEEDTPFCSTFSLMSSKLIKKPSNLVIRKMPSLDHYGKIYTCMDIILVNTNHTDKHGFNLEFDVIGRIDL
jgi:hypothetical protein